MLERLGFDTILMDMAPTGVSLSTSTSSVVLKHATTPVKPRGGVGGLTNASVLAGSGDFGGNRAFDGFGWWANGRWSRWVEGPFSLAAVQQLVGGFPLWLLQVGMGVLLCPTQHTLGPPLVLMDTSVGAVWCQCAVSAVGAEGLLPVSLGRFYSLKNLFICEGKVESYLSP